MMSRFGTLVFYLVIVILVGNWILSPPVEEDSQAGEISDVTVSPQTTPGPAAQLDKRPPLDRAKQLKRARETFAKGEFDVAIARYRRHLRKYPEDVDARGELGNVYHHTGRVNEAAATFFDVANQLIDNGNRQGAIVLEPIVRRTHPAFADEIQRRLEGGPSAVGGTTSN